MERICPQGHVSTDPDYCSECGTKLAGAVSAITAATAIAPEELAAATGEEPCPVWATRRAAGTRFCKVCRYVFQTATASGPAPAQTSPSAPAIAEQSPAPD